MFNKLFKKSFAIPKLFFSIIVIVTFACSLSVPSTTQPTITPEADIELQTPTLASELETPISLSLPPVQIFSIDNADTVPPENIFEEVSFAISGGGGGPGECPYHDPSSPTIGLDTDNRIILDEGETELIKFTVCGWEFDEKINVMIKTPSGTEVNDSIMATRPYFSNNPNDAMSFAVTDFEYLLDAGEYGKYEFAFEGKSGFIKNVVTVISPDLKMSYLQDNTGSNQHNFYIQGLSPNEEVRIVLYRNVTPDEPEYNDNENKYKFVASSRFISNPNGELLIQIDLKSLTYAKLAVVGNLSGLIPFRDGLVNVEKIYSNGSCVPDAWVYPHVIPTRLDVGDFAYISLNSPQVNNLRSDAGKSNVSIDKIYPGEVIEIVGGPICIEGVNWWQVEGKDRNFEGWTSEGEGEYWLVPCSPKNQACP